MPHAGSQFVCKHSFPIWICVSQHSIFRYKIDLCQLTSVSISTRSVHWNRKPHSIGKNQIGENVFKP